VKYSPNNVEYQLTLGDSLDARNKRKDALAVYRKATQLGIFYEKEIGSTKLAVKAFRTYVEKGGKDERVRNWPKELGSPMKDDEGK